MDGALSGRPQSALSPPSSSTKKLRPGGEDILDAPSINTPDSSFGDSSVDHTLSYGMNATPGAPVFSQELRRRTPKAGAFGGRIRELAHEKKFNNSTNSLYIIEAPTAPDDKELLRCVARAIVVLMNPPQPGSPRLPKSPTSPTNSNSNNSGLASSGSGDGIFLSIDTPPVGRVNIEEELFDERSHPLKNGMKRGIPSWDECYSFIRTVYKRTHMQPECAVMALSYVERLLKQCNGRVRMAQHTWRRMVLAAMVVADKVFEDYAVWNADFLALFPQTDIVDMNALERHFLTLMKFETAFKASDYAQYYFALKELSDHKDALPSRPLSKQQADRLEKGSLALQKSRSDQWARQTEVTVAGMDVAIPASKRQEKSSNSNADDE